MDDLDNTMDGIRPGLEAVMRRRRATAREALTNLAGALEAARHGGNVLPTLEDGPGPEGGAGGYSETLRLTGRMRERMDDLSADVTEALRLLGEHEAQGYDD